jgi:hypothetical protein
MQGKNRLSKSSSKSTIDTDAEYDTEPEDVPAKKRGLKGVNVRRNTKRAKPSHVKREGLESPEVLIQEWNSFIASPPATIQFSSAMPVPLPPYWSTKRGAKDAADCRRSMDIARLIGSTTLTFDVPRLYDPEAILLHLSQPVKGTLEVLRKDDRDPQVVTWNDDGEPGSVDCLSVTRILAACERGELVPRDIDADGGAPLVNRSSPAPQLC